MKDIAHIIQKAKTAGVGLQLVGEDLELALYQEEVADEIIDLLRDNKAAIKSYLQDINNKADHQPIPVLPVAEHYELSSAQHRLWVLSQLGEASLAYNLPMQLELKGSYRWDDFRRAVELIVKRHEILRTIFKVSEEGTVRQWIIPAADFSFQVAYHDWRAESDSETLLQNYLEEDEAQAFDLEKGPLLRAAILHLEKERSVFYCNMHHIISDAWSLDILMREVFTLYEGLGSGETVELPELNIHYKDYAVWQKQQAQGLAFQKSKAYWLERFGDELPSFDLPFAKARPQLRNYQGQALYTQFSAKLSERARQFSREQEASLFMTLLAAWKVLLYRYTGQKDVLIGTPVAGREHLDLQNQIGFYLNTLVLRNPLDPQASFTDYLATVKQNTLLAYAHAIYPFDDLVNDLSIPRDMSRNPIFDVMITLQNTALKSSEVKAVGDEVVDWPQRYAKFDLDLVFQDQGDHLALTLAFNPAVYDKQSLLPMIQHFRQLLESLLTQPHTAIATQSFLSEREVKELLEDFNATQQDLPQSQTVLDLIAERVFAHPDRIALVCGNTQLSYRQLDQYSSQLADFLSRETQLAPDDLVGVKLERNENLLLALLAVLKTSAAYVPIDPDYPQDRIAFIEKSSACKLVIDQSLLQRFWQHQDQYAKDFHDTRIHAQNLAYAIYTSGSTGTPKGVMVEHRNLLNFIYGMKRELKLDATNHLLAITSVSFDISILELFYTLSQGVRVTIKPKSSELSNFNQYLATNQRSLDFSLLFFSSQKTDASDKYKLLLDTVTYADQHGFNAVWLPERHFHEFGGIFPNPSILGAALATVTEQINIRSGSVVLPLHDTIRVAEEWAVVDNLSKGRVSLSIASGWHSNDFVLQPDRYAKRHAAMFSQIEELRQLWRGEKVERVNGVGKKIKLQTFPRPIQAELPIWVTSGGNPETFRSAGKIGANVLTHLLGQDIEVLRKNIAIYRESLAEHGHSVEQSKVSLMLHSYVGTDLEVVKARVKEPFTNYLRSSIGLIKNMLKEFTEDTDNIGEEDLENLLELAFERYWQTSALFGTAESCTALLEKIKIIGVDEIACLIDFGLEQELVMEGLDYLDDLREKFYRPTASEATAVPAIDSMQITPSYLKTLLEDEYSAAFLPSLQNLIVGGERFPQSLADRLTEQLPARITNMYGPTETTIWSTVQEIRAREEVTVGKPISNTSIYILDEHLQLCPKGIIGHLYIGGQGLARGYHGREDLTAERFIPHPFSTEPNARIYHTGDLAYWRSDGNIVLLGRSDNQVKINGYRIELEEIEQQLLQHPALQDVAVSVVEDEAGHKSLRAYLVAPGSIFTNELREYLSEKLPHYMVPASFVELEKMPLTANGKIDRNALSRVANQQLDSGIAFAEPSNEIETRLVNIWSEVLGKEADLIGVKSNFFDLGGNSILAVKLLSKINTVFQVQIPLVHLYQESNIQKLAQYLSGQKSTLNPEVEEEHLDALADTMESAFNKLINNEH